MGISKKQLHDLKSALKRRERRPETAFVPPAKLELTHRQRDRVTSTCPGILLSVETMFIENWKLWPNIDDTDVERALVCAIRRLEEPEGEHIKTLVKDLDVQRAHWLDLEESEEMWTLALRAILQSVQTHSSGLPGSRYYLNFTFQFLADAKRKLQAKPGLTFGSPR